MYPERSDLQLTDEKGADSEELPAFFDEERIWAVIANQDDTLKYKKQQIELFFAVHTDDEERAEYVRSAYQGQNEELVIGNVRVGFCFQEDGLRMWEGTFSSRTKESVFSWGTVADWISALIEKKEYAVNGSMKPVEGPDLQQISLFGFDVADAPKKTEQAPENTSFGLPQQVIDTALCLGGNEPDCLERIYSFFSKDYALERNAEFLRNEYGKDGKGFYLEKRPYALWFDENGMLLSHGRSTAGHRAVQLSWEDAAKRIRELLELGRYVPESVIRRADTVEKTRIATSLLFFVREDLSEDARNRGYMPTLKALLDSFSGFPEMLEQLFKNLQEESFVRSMMDELQILMDEHTRNPALLQSLHHNPAEIFLDLQGLLREPIVFPVPEEEEMPADQFITEDEIDKLLTGGSGMQSSKFRIYSFYKNNHTPQERVAFLKEEYGTGGWSRTGFVESHDGQGISYSREDRFFKPYDTVQLSWNKVEKRIAEIIRQNRYMTEEELAYIPIYEKNVLAQNICSFFQDVSREQPRPFPYGMEISRAVSIVRSQLDESRKVEEIYQMMLPVWEATTRENRHFSFRQNAMEQIMAYRSGTFSLFGESKAPQEIQTDTNAELEEARALINAYCMEVFEQEADFSNLNHVDLAYSSTRDREHVVEIYADLIEAMLVYEVDERIVRVISCERLSELNEYLANLDFDRMVEDAENALQPEKEKPEPEPPVSAPQPPAEEERQTEPVSEEEQQAETTPEGQQNPDLAPPKPKRERAIVSVLYPEIPAERRNQFHITDMKLGEGTHNEKYAGNVAAIRTLKSIEAEARLATAEEQQILSRYVGWGGLADCFAREETERELQNLMTKEEYASARASCLTAFYTPPVIIRFIYQALEQMGFRGGNILDIILQSLIQCRGIIEKCAFAV